MQKSEGKEETKAGSKDTIHPLDDRVLIEGLSDDELNTRSVSGIIIPETVNKEKPMQGRVVAVGPGKYNEDGKRVPMQVKEGDRVIFSKYSPDEIKIDGKEYFILSESSILAVIK